MSTVFITNVAGHDFSAAKKYGRLLPVTTGNVNVFRPDRELFNIAAVLEKFDFETDYLLLSGNVFANALAVAALAYDGCPSIKLLIYDAKNQEYIQHVLAYDIEEGLKFSRKKKTAA